MANLGGEQVTLNITASGKGLEMLKALETRIKILEGRMDNLQKELSRGNSEVSNVSEFLNSNIKVTHA